MVLFATQAQAYIYLNQFNNGPAVQADVLATPYQDGQTNLYDALNIADSQIFSSVNGARSNVPKVMIIVTDGVDTKNPGSTVGLAQQLKNKGYNIITVGVTNAIDVTKLQQIASTNLYFNVSSYSNLNVLTSILSNAVCPTPTTTVPPGELFFVYIRFIWAQIISSPNCYSLELGSNLFKLTLGQRTEFCNAGRGGVVKLLVTQLSEVIET